MYTALSEGSAGTRLLPGASKYLKNRRCSAQLQRAGLPRREKPSNLLNCYHYNSFFIFEKLDFRLVSSYSSVIV